MSILRRRMMMAEGVIEMRGWKKIKTIVVENEERYWIHIDKDDDGNEFSVRELLIYIKNADKNSQAWHKVWKEENATENNDQTKGIIAKWYGNIAANKNMMIRITPDYNVGYGMEYGGQDVANGHGGYCFTETDTPITVITMYNQYPPATGSEITVYGR